MATLPSATASSTDAELLQRFVNKHDDLAFAIIVERHSAMVWAVCKGILRNHHAAEDAFQATFLVLARRGQTIVPRERLASWLFGVARKTAIKARSLGAIRRSREVSTEGVSEPAASDSKPDEELRELIDREIASLPEKYRSVILLCDIKGKTRKEAALELGAPEGSIAGWQSRGRELLTKRLVRRGIVVTSITLVSLLIKAGEAFAVTTISSQTLSSAKGCGVGRSAISSTVSLLSEKVISLLFWTKIKSLAVVGVTVLFAVGLAGWMNHSMAQGQKAKSAGEIWREAEKSELADLAGVWELVQQSINGNPSEAKFKVYRLIISTDHTAWVEHQIEGDDETTDPVLSLSINPAKKVREINLYRENVLIQAIYRRDGNRLTIAHFGISEVDRPKAFNFEDAGGDFMPLITWELKKK